MEARLAKVEATVEKIETDIRELRADVRELRNQAREDFRILFAAMIGSSLGLAGLMAKGFHWF